MKIDSNKPFPERFQRIVDLYACMMEIISKFIFFH